MAAHSRNRLVQPRHDREVRIVAFCMSMDLQSNNIHDLLTRRGRERKGDMS